MIQIYNPDNTNFDQNGDMTLFPTSATVHPILNGAWEAELTHPIDREGRWKHIVKNAVVKMPSFNGDQFFRVKDTQKSDAGITAAMEPIFYDAMGDCWLEDIRPTAKNGQEALEIMLAPNGKYSGRSDITKAATAYYQNVNFFEALNGDIDQSFISRWGGEILFDNFTVIVNERAGGDYGVEVRYGKNIPEDGISEEVDIRNVVTRIYPKAYNGYTMTDNGHVDSPLINDYPIIQSVAMTFEDVKMAEDAQEDDAENGVVICETQEELDAALTQKCQEQYDAGIDKPTVTISVDMVLLQNTEQYKDVQMLEAVSLGDTIHCIDNYLDIVTDARVIELEYDSIRKKVSSVVIGDFQGNYFDRVTSSTNKIDAVIAQDGTVMAEKVQGILNAVYTQLRLQSTVAEKVDGVAFRVEDLDPESPMYGCMIWGTQGIQISTTRTADGRGWDWTTAITAKGIVADAIITGILSDKTGTNYWNLDTGEFQLTSSAFQVDGENIKDYIEQISDQGRAITLELSNDMASVVTDPAGNGGNYSECKTTATLFFGSENITAQATFAATPSAGVTGSWDNSTHTYTVSNMTTDSGTVTIKATFGGVSATKVFDIAKVKQGAQGIQGPPGENGETLYTWIKYADTPTSGMSDSPDGKTYMGIAYNKDTPTESTDYSDYQWSLIKGANGSQGIQGPPGEDGQSLYTWVKYATSADGANMSDNPDGMTFLGLAYNKTTPTESNNPADYTWAFFEGPQGEKGEQGIPGKDGANGTNGKTSYFHVKYSANANGNPMTETPNTYIGTYVDFTEADSTNYQDYTWSRFEGAQGPQGQQGIPGTNGANGKTSYLHIKYSNDGGVTFTANGGETPGDWIGQYVDFTQTDSTDPDSYAWSLTKGADGRVYMIQPSVQTMVLGADNKFTPTQITFLAYYRDGTTAKRTAYAGRFIIAESTNGTSFTNRYTSASNESSHTYTPTSANVKVIRCSLYASGGTSQLLDQESASVVKDIDNLTQDEVFNILTNNGQAQGIYMQNGKLYINGSYIGVGKIASHDGKTYFDLDNDQFVISGATNGKVVIDTPNFKINENGDVNVVGELSSKSSNGYAVYLKAGSVELYNEKGVFIGEFTLTTNNKESDYSNIAISGSKDSKKIGLGFDNDGSNNIYNYYELYKDPITVDNSGYAIRHRFWGNIAAQHLFFVNDESNNVGSVIPYDETGDSSIFGIAMVADYLDNISLGFRRSVGATSFSHAIKVDGRDNGRVRFYTNVTIPHDAKGNIINGCRFYCGTNVYTIQTFLPGITYISFTNQSIRDNLGVANANGNNTIVLACNGDNDANGWATNGCTYVASSDTWNVFIDGGTAGALARVNLFIICWA